MGGWGRGGGVEWLRARGELGELGEVGWEGEYFKTFFLSFFSGDEGV